MAQKKLALPPGVSVIRQGKAYVIFRDGYEAIGGVIVSETTQGNTQLKPYMNVDASDNKAVIAFVAQQMTDALLQHQAQKPLNEQLPIFTENVPDNVQVIENKSFPCSRCNSIIAKLIFVPEAATASAMLAMAQKLELDAFVSPYPVWLIGAPDSQNDDIAQHLTLQIAPVKGEVYWQHPDHMNQRLIELDIEHRCTHHHGVNLKKDLY
ncbi:hypothetical protein ACQKC5_18865 [Shewanella baltica]|uniref:hypothetical protein n=1 Tax=Shewanella baltica TaxID=62322 RepID=UPI003D076D50